VYTLSLSDRSIHRLTTGQTGNYYPSVRGDSLVWSHFTSNGLQVQTAAIDPSQWKAVASWQERNLQYPVANPQNVLGVMNRRFTEKRYDKTTGLFNFHSWQPNYVDPEFTFSLFSDNILNTFTNELYYRYNQNEKSHAVGFSTLYGGLFPVLRAGVEYNFNRTVALGRNIAQLDELEASVGYNIPLNLTKGKGYRFMNFGSSFVLNKPLPKGQFKDSLVSDAQTYLSHFLSFSHYLPMARQHIYPKLGITSSFTFRHDLQNRRRQFGINGNLFLPSLGNHAIVVNGAYQDTRVSTGFAPFSNRFALSRGYTDLYFTRMWKVGANYYFPLFYPDLGIAQVVYFQRLRGNGFFDYSRTISLSGTEAPVRSVGGELYFDTRWWNQLPVSFGVRVSYLLDNTRFDKKGTTYFEFILPLNLIPR
jgi:hypothetical protein